MKKRVSRLLMGAMALVVLMIPFEPVWGSYTIILLGIVGVSNAIALKKIEKMPVFVYLLVGAYVVRVLWVFLAIDRPYAFKTLETEFPLLVFPLIFSTFRITTEMKNFVVRIYCLTLTGVMLYAFWRLVVYFETSPYTFLDYTKFHLDPTWFWEHSRNFAQSMLTWELAHYSFINILIIYGMHVFFYMDNKTKLDRILFAAYIVFSLLFLIYSGSRIGFVAYVVAFAGYVLFANDFIFQRRKLFLILCGFCAIILIVFLVKWGERIEPIRYHYWSRAADAFKVKPFFGHGTGAGKIIMSEPEFEEKVGWGVNHPHDQFLTELIQFGIIGSIPLFAFLIFSFWHGVTQKNKPLISLIVTMIVFMITEAPLNSNKGLVPFLFLFCLLLNFANNVATRDRETISDGHN